jgi:hypothetical protein
MYDLKLTGVTDLARFTQLLEIRKVTRDPLQGAVNGSNKYFYSNSTPLLSSGSTVVVVNGSSVANTVVYETGEFYLTAAPSYQPYANYTYSSLTSENVTRILLLGFDEMEQRWARGWRLSSSNSSYSAGDETSSALYVSAKDSLSDPTSSGILFSTSKSQIAFYMKSCQYAYISQQQLLAATETMNYREAGGMAVSNEKRADVLDRTLTRLERELTRALMIAQAEWLRTSGGFGAAILPEHSTDYDANFEWRPSRTGSNENL